MQEGQNGVWIRTLHGRGCITVGGYKCHAIVGCSKPTSSNCSYYPLLTNDRHQQALLLVRSEAWSYSYSTDHCSSLPPVVAKDYIPKGRYEPYSVFDKAYITGPEGTGKALVFVYDVFGYVFFRSIAFPALMIPHVVTILRPFKAQISSQSNSTPK